MQKNEKHLKEPSLQKNADTGVKATTFESTEHET